MTDCSHTHRLGDNLGKRRRIHAISGLCYRHTGQILTHGITLSFEASQASERYRASCVQLDLLDSDCHGPPSYIPRWPLPTSTLSILVADYSFPHQYPRTPTDRFTTAPKPSISSVTPRTTNTDLRHGDLAGFGRNTGRGFKGIKGTLPVESCIDFVEILHRCAVEPVELIILSHVQFGGHTEV